MVNYLALDVGTVRIGLALANDIARLAAPLPAVQNDAVIADTLRRLIAEHNVAELVIGLPRGLDGQETAQTAYVQAWLDGLNPAPPVPVSWQDEAVTSIKAEQELMQRGKPYSKAAIDSLSAVYILQDYLAQVHYSQS